MAAARTDLFRYRLPLKAPFVHANGSVSDRSGLLVAFRYERGVSLGEAAPLEGFSRETLEEVLDRAAGIHPLLKELASTLDMREQHRLIRRAALPDSLAFAVSAIAIDVACASSSKPVADLLGVAADDLRLNAVIGLHVSRDGASPGIHDALESLSASVEAGRREGVDEFKIKAGPDVDATAALLRQACLLHPDVGWKLDFNGSLTIEQYRAFGALLDPGTAAAIRYVEDPVACRTPDELAAVRQACKLPLAFEWTAEAVELPLESVIGMRLADAVVVKPMVLGAIHRWPELHAQATTHGVPIIVSSLIESGVARSQTAHIARLFGARHHTHGLLTGRLFKADLVEDDWIDRGRIRIPHGVGWVHSSLGDVRPELHPLLKPIGAVELSSGDPMNMSTHHQP